jgi:hypothetical protein
MCYWLHFRAEVCVEVVAFRHAESSSAKARTAASDSRNVAIWKCAVSPAIRRNAYVPLSEPSLQPR